MAHRKLSTVLASLTERLNQTEQFAVAAHQWSAATFPKGVPKFSVHHKEIVNEIAFLRAFLAWEAFLEESFILYLWGKAPPRGHPPRRYALPPTRKVTEKLIIRAGRPYADWANVLKVIELAECYFEDGKPYSLLAIHQNKFQDIRIIRNAIAHASTHSWESFQGLARRELRGTYPPNLTIGGFLSMTVPGSHPPESFFEHYLSYIRFAAKSIVPT